MWSKNADIRMMTNRHLLDNLVWLYINDASTCFIGARCI
jgi:hypothetical protein